MPSSYFTEKQLAAELGISYKSIQHHRLAGTLQIPHFKIGGRILYSVAELEAAIKKLQIGKPSVKKTTDHDDRQKLENQGRQRLDV